jgi:hypothetical protein
MTDAGGGNGVRRGVQGLLFFAGTEIGYNLYGSMKSSPETSHFRVAGMEGGGAPERVLMFWVWVANAKVLLIAGIGSVISRSVWPLIGGLVAGAGMHGAYRLAIAMGRRDRAAGGLGRGMPQRPDSYAAGRPQQPTRHRQAAVVIVPPGSATDEQVEGARVRVAPAF